MKLLFDQNVLRRLVDRFIEDYPESAHVATLELDEATDHEIWAYAGEHGYVIVSKDSDCRQLAFLLGPPAKAIWVRVGNASTVQIAAIIELHQDDIARFGADDEEALLVIE
ncbi:MAG: DUF5615 family PIN-like protein [Actinomycetota bacterium]